MIRSRFAAFAAVPVLLVACATDRGRSEPPAPEAQKETTCNSALAALIGGAIGAVILEENRTRGAAVGAGLGTLACAIINATTRELKGQGEVEKEYRASHDGELPSRPLVAVYDTAYNAAGSVRGGQAARVVSNITLVPGSREPVREMREQLEIFETASSEQPMLKAEKVVQEKRAGALQNIFEIKLPERLAAGDYPARTTLYVNGERAGENRGTLRVLDGRR